MRDAQFRIPTRQLDGHLLLEVLNQRVGAFRSSRVLLIYGNVGSSMSKGRPSTVSLEA